MGSKGIAARILDLTTRWKWSASCPDHFSPREETQDPLNRRIDEPQSHSGYS